MKTIYLLLTRYHKPIDDILSIPFNHVSLSIDDQHYYTFNRKGFACESKTFASRKISKKLLITLEVSDEAYAIIEEELNYFIAHAKQYQYSCFGAVLCYLHIPHKFKNHYFCSQFVLHCLKKSKVVKKRHASTCLPHFFDCNVKYLYKPKYTYLQHN